MARAGIFRFSRIVALATLTIGLTGASGIAYAGASGQPFTVKITVLPSGRIAATPTPPSALVGANTPLSPAQRRMLLRTTAAPTVSISYR